MFGFNQATILLGEGFGPAAGAFAAGYGLGQWINEETGWSHSLAERGKSVEEATGSTFLGFVAATPVVGDIGYAGYEVGGWLATPIDFDAMRKYLQSQQ